MLSHMNNIENNDFDSALFCCEISPSHLFHMRVRFEDRELSILSGCCVLRDLLVLSFYITKGFVVKVHSHD